MKDDRKIVLVCRFSPTCSGDKPCEKCPFFTELKIVDLTLLEDNDEDKEVGEVCSCS